MNKNIRIIKNCCGNFIYNVSENKIFEITKDELSSFQKYIEKDKIDEIIEKKYMEKGYLKTTFINEINHPYTHLSKYYLDSCIESVVLQVTESCNFKCRYCNYSGDGTYDRKHSTKSMKWEIAKESIDFLVEHSENAKSVCLAFYGGEPLLYFDLIKKSIDYIKKIAGYKEIVYRITTNGSLLNEKIIKYFLENKVLLTISLDGPKHINDKNRRLVSNGNGTYELIFSKIKLIYDSYPEYLQYLDINAVWDNEESYEEICDFFNNNEILKNIPCSITQVSSDRINTYYAPDEEQVMNFNRFLAKCILCKLKICKENITSIDKMLNSFNLIKKNFENNNIMNNSFHHNGPCIPGQRKLFVSVNGDFYPCEKTTENSSTCKIGTIKDGFYEEKIKLLMNIGKLTEDDCKTCYAKHTCVICPAMIETGNGLSLSIKKKLCNDIRKNFKEMIKDYIILNKIGYYDI